MSVELALGARRGPRGGRPRHPGARCALKHARLPIDVRAIQTTDLDSLGRRSRAVDSVRKSCCGRSEHDHCSPALRVNQRGRRFGAVQSSAAPHGSRALAICVLPFANMSGDPEQEYFSDGITEDIITDLSKVSALAVVSRNSAFQYSRASTLTCRKLARELKVGHVLEGSVRKAGGRVRITAQLVDGSSDDHVVGRALRPRPERHLRASGRNLRSDRQGAEAQAAARREEGHRAARHREHRGLQPST